MIKAKAQAEGDGGTNPTTGSAWKRHEILAVFVEKQIRISREAVRMLEDTSVTTPKEVCCHGCNKTGHIQSKCPDKPKAGKTANAITNSGGKACPHCKETGGHTFKEMPSRRLYCCPKFMQLESIEAKAKVIQDLSGCFLCLDPSHNTNACKSTYRCKVKTGTGSECGRKHSHYIHGANGFVQCNMLVAKATIKEQSVLL